MFLFSGTIRDNIKYGRLEASEAEVIEAAKAVNAHEFIMKLENGYDTVISERGSGLSIGQRQLLAFARTMVSRPGILILDEATSSIDTHTELLVQEGDRRSFTGAELPLSLPTAFLRSARRTAFLSLIRGISWSQEAMKS